MRQLLYGFVAARLARILHERSAFVNNAPTGAASVAPVKGRRPANAGTSASSVEPRSRSPSISLGALSMSKGPEGPSRFLRVLSLSKGGLFTCS